MIDIHDDAQDIVPFNDVHRSLGTLTAGDAAALAMAAGDVSLIVDREGIVRDAAGSGGGFADLRGWIGRRWADLVTVESRAKVGEMLADAAVAAPRWRQINHLGGAGDVPMRYLAFAIGEGERIVAIGRDVRPSAALQQRLLQVQQSLERDYLRLRQAESRYRLLFEMTSEPMLIVEGASRRIREINPVAARLLAATAGALTGQPIGNQVVEDDRDALTAFLGAAAAGAEVAPVSVRLNDGTTVAVAASVFRQGGANYFLLRLAEGAPASASARPDPLVDIVERMPDAFVLTDATLAILTANSAFVELVQATSLDQMRGRSLGDVLGRPGIDLDLILGQLADQGGVRNVATILRGLDGGREEVEVSAVRAGEDGGHYGFSLRAVGRRLRDLPPMERDLPRSVEQLTELVGRMPLKDIVRESTDLIERLCIEAALAYTSNNRASAAEILGLSRQSLYAKLHRHGLGNLGGDLN